MSQKAAVVLPLFQHRAEAASSNHEVLSHTARSCGLCPSVNPTSFFFTRVHLTHTHPQCRPVLEQIEYLDNLEKQEEEWRAKKEAESKAHDVKMKKLQRSMGAK